MVHARTHDDDDVIEGLAMHESLSYLCTDAYLPEFRVLQRSRCLNVGFYTTLTLCPKKGRDDVARHCPLRPVSEKRVSDRFAKKRIHAEGVLNWKEMEGWARVVRELRASMPYLLIASRPARIQSLS